MQCRTSACSACGQKMALHESLAKAGIDCLIIELNVDTVRQLKRQRLVFARRVCGQFGKARGAHDAAGNPAREGFARASENRQAGP